MPSEWTSPFWVIAEVVRSLQVGFGAWIVLACGALFVAGGWLMLLRRQRGFALLAVLPAVVGGGLMLAESHNLWPRFFFFAMGFAMLIVIYGIFEIPRLFVGLAPRTMQAGIRMAGPVASILLITASILTLPRCYAIPKQDFTGARDFVMSSKRPNESVITVGLAAHAFRYYAPSWKVASTPAQLTDDTYLVYTLGTELKAFHPELWRDVQKQFESVRTFPGTLGGGEVVVCRRRTATQAVALLGREGK
jgi:mannosyltransferase